MTTTTNRPTPSVSPGRRRRVSHFVRDFPQVHLGLGLFGNFLFVVGSIMFFYPSVKTAAVWIFVVASVGMFLGSLGQMVVRIDKQREQRRSQQ